MANAVPQKKEPKKKSASIKSPSGKIRAPHDSHPEKQRSKRFRVPSNPIKNKTVASMLIRQKVDSKGYVLVDSSIR